MRLAAAALLLISMVLLGCAAFLGPGRWQVALFLGVALWSLTLVFIVAALAEVALPDRAAWTRSALALLAGLGAVGVSLKVRPGNLDDYPFHDLLHSGASVAALGFAAGALLLGAAAVRLGKRAPALLGALGIFLAAFALRDWLKR